MKHRLFSAALVLCLLLGLCPAAAALRENPAEASVDCALFIAVREGFSPVPYSDGTGWYIGYGASCDPADYPDGITEEEAFQLLRDRLELCAEAVTAFLDRYDVSVTQSQFDALCAMTYNFGSSWLSISNRLPSYLADGIENYTDTQIVNAFAAWCHIGTRVSEPLLRRRIEEARMFLYEEYGGCDGWYYLLLQPEGGSVTSDVACYPADEPYGTLPACTRSGKVFAGWAVVEDGDALYLLSEDDIAEENLTLRAIWVGDEFFDPPAEPPEPQELPPEDDPAPSVPDAGISVENEPPAETEDHPYHFPDVPAGSWFYDYVTDLSRQGVVNGFPDGTFRPQEDVSWGQALKLILIAAGYGEQTAEPGEHWAAAYLRFAGEKQFLSPNRVSDLDAPISRLAIAEITAAALELDTGSTDDNPFADTDSGAVIALNHINILQGSFENEQRVYKGADSITRAEISAIICRVSDYVAENLILHLGYRIPVNHDLPANPYDPDAFLTADGRVYYNDLAYDVRYGIDVSFYQHDIDWEAVADDGIDFAILRAGYRGCTGGELFTDERFFEYLSGARAAGLDVGLYFFSQATSPEEAAEEARYLLSLIDGQRITFPIAFDWEPLNYTGSRTANFDYSRLTDCALAFCDTIAAAGYTPMVYLNPTFAYLRFDLPRLSGYVTWLANYVERTAYRYDFQLWQYGSSGAVDGIDGRVDMNIAFFDFGA